MNAVDAVQAVEVACHRALNVPEDTMSRVMLLEALASFKSTPLDFSRMRVQRSGVGATGLNTVTTKTATRLATCHFDH